MNHYQVSLDGSINDGVFSAATSEEAVEKAAKQRGWASTPEVYAQANWDLVECIAARDEEGVPDICPVHGEEWPCGGVLVEDERERRAARPNKEKDIELNDGGVIEAPDPQGVIRRFDQFGNTEDVATPGESDYQRLAAYFPGYVPPTDEDEDA